jgi:5-methyltetrahydropteroyltriglutamate--homocysteine methyltransferase
MPLLTTTIGAYPKPGYVRLPDWFQGPDGPDTANPTERWAAAMAALGPDATATIARGIREAVADQIEAGIDIPTDGEIPRENYIHYHCRHIAGIDFSRLGEAELRGGTYRALLPSVTGPVAARDSGFLVEDWRVAQAAAGERPVKITLPGPMTIGDTTVDAHYGDAKRLGADLAAALNVEVLALSKAGCRHIQIDEPLFARRPEAALAFGLENLERAFHGCPPAVTRTMHMCCGYPNRLDNRDYPKADPQAYLRLADARTCASPTRSRHRASRQSRSRTPTATTTSPCSSASPPPASSSASSASPAAGWRRWTRSARASPPRSATLTPGASSLRRTAGWGC